MCNSKEKEFFAFVVLAAMIRTVHFFTCGAEVSTESAYWNFRMNTPFNLTKVVAYYTH